MLKLHIEELARIGVTPRDPGLTTGLGGGTRLRRRYEGHGSGEERDRQTLHENTYGNEYRAVIKRDRPHSAK